MTLLARVDPRRVLFSILAAFGLFGVPASAQELERPTRQIGFFFVRSNPAFGQHVLTTVMPARYETPRPGLILEQYHAAVERSYQEPAPYQHHATVAGPFATRKQAEAALAEQRSEFGGAPTMRFQRSEYQRIRNIASPPFVFHYYDDSVLVLWPGAHDARRRDPAMTAREEVQTLDAVFDQMPVFQRHRSLPAPEEDVFPVSGATNDRLVVVIAPELVYGAEAAVFVRKLSELLSTRPDAPEEDGLPESTPIVVLSLDRAFAGSWERFRARQDTAAGDGLAARIILVGPDPPATPLRERFETLVHSHVKPWKPPILINELLASNAQGHPDEKGEFDDWVELYNPTEAPFDVGGLRLSDKSNLAGSWEIPDDVPEQTTLPPRGYLVIWCDEQPEQGPLHASFKLSSKGETLTLLDIDYGVVIDQIKFGAQTADVAYGRRADGDETWISMPSMTPGQSNTATAGERSSSPRGSLESGDVRLQDLPREEEQEPRRPNLG